MQVAMKGSGRYLLLGCCLVGAVLSAISLHNHYSASATEYCDLSATFNCDIVNRSSYARLFGIPVALIGLIGYLLLFTLSFGKHWLLTAFQFVASLIGLAFALYLAYVEAYILAAWCLLCIGSLAAISGVTLLSGLSLRRAWTMRVTAPLAEATRPEVLNRVGKAT
jgi:vitamin-K-epoxide reductase (warfarin-sensitive)